MADTSILISLTYEPGSAFQAGGIGLGVYARSQEDNASNIETANTTTQTALEPINNGYDVSVANASGTENPFAKVEADRSNVVQLDISGSGLVDADGSESVGAVLLKDVPKGFLVYVGDNAQSAEQASLATNAGGAGTNTWLLGEGEIPDYVGIMAPRYWSGTLEDLTLVVNSGENTLADTETTTALFDMTISAVANGVTLDPTPSFGTEGDVIPLNLNHVLADRQNVGNGDASSETMTLEIEGLGEHAGVYIDSNLISGTGQVSYDLSTNTHTVSGLSSEDAEGLGFIQAANDIGNVQVRARSEESSNADQSAWSDWADISITVDPALSTTGDDVLLWTGSPIDGQSGEDTVKLRFSEELTGNELGSNLDNVETLDMQGNGTNAITALDPQDVLDMTDADNALEVLGDPVDSLALGAGWTEGTTGAGFVNYSGDVSGETVTLKVDDQLTIE